MELLNKPIPHILGSLDESFYSYCLNSWPVLTRKEVNVEGRYNIAISDPYIISELSSITKKAFHKLLPHLIAEYPKWKPANIEMKFQFAGNIVSDVPYKMRDWHLDNGDKVMIGLWYFKHPDDTNDGGLYVSNMEDSHYYSYKTNQCIFMPNLTNAWHKVGDRSIWTHERRFINIVVKQKQFLHDYLRGADDKDGFTEVKNLMI